MSLVSKKFSEYADPADIEVCDYYTINSNQLTMYGRFSESDTFTRVYTKGTSSSTEYTKTLTVSQRTPYKITLKLQAGFYNTYQNTIRVPNDSITIESPYTIVGNSSYYPTHDYSLTQSTFNNILSLTKEDVSTLNIRIWYVLSYADSYEEQNTDEGLQLGEERIVYDVNTPDQALTVQDYVLADPENHPWHTLQLKSIGTTYYIILDQKYVVPLDDTTTKITS